MKLNSYDEWSPLREVIVGSAENYTSHDTELSFDLFFHENVTRSEWYYPRLHKRQDDPSANTRSTLPIKQRYVDELVEDVEGIAEALRGLGVTVLRPLPLDPATSEVTTPAWSAAVVPPLNVRDISLIAGDEIIETAPMVRSRYFETQFLKPIFQNYFGQGARWTVMPRPFMTDASFDTAYAAEHSIGGPTEPLTTRSTHPYDVGHEILFDGAQCLRFGRDIIANVSTANHRLAFDWLERHLDSRFRLHRVDELSDSHIDSMVLALRPGLLLVRSREVMDKLPAALQRWDYIEAPVPESNNFPTYDDDDLILTSLYIDLNVLSVSPDTVLVNEACPELVKTLEVAGFTVVPVRHRHRRLFGGGFHCFTLDTVRDGGCEDYLS